MYLASMWIFSVGIILSSISVVTSIKPVNGIISLILTYINSIGIFMIINQDFIGLIYCIVYVGAIAILFLFIILLLYNSPKYIKKEEKIKKEAVDFSKGSKLQYIRNILSIAGNKLNLYNNQFIIVVIGIVFILEIYCAIIELNLYGNSNTIDNLSINNTYCNDIYSFNNLNMIAYMLYGVFGYELLLVIGLILLVGMIGAIVLTLK